MRKALSKGTVSETYRPVPAEEVFANFSAAERAAMKARADGLIAEEYVLRDLRKAKKVLQEQ